MTGALSPTHWLIIIGVVLVLFGAKRLPDAARGLGRSLRILKSETSVLRDEESTAEPAGAPEGASPTGEDRTAHQR